MRTFLRKCRRITHVAPVLCLALEHLPARGSAQRPGRPKPAPREIFVDVLKDTSWLEITPPPIDSIPPNVVAEPLDLNGDRTPELEVRAVGYICRSPNNCRTWIYRRRGAGYERLLDTGSIQSLQVQQSLTRGYRDIMTSMHGGAWDSDLTLYKFDGREYRRSACFSRRDSFLDRQGNFHLRKKPRISRVPCPS